MNLKRAISKTTKIKTEKEKIRVSETQYKKWQIVSLKRRRKVEYEKTKEKWKNGKAANKTSQRS